MGITWALLFLPCLQKKPVFNLGEKKKEKKDPVVQRTDILRMKLTVLFFLQWCFSFSESQVTPAWTDSITNLSYAFALCGTPCLRSGKGSTLEPTLRATSWYWDWSNSFNFVVSWSAKNMTNTSGTTSMLDMGYQMKGNVYAIQVCSGSPLTPINFNRVSLPPLLLPPRTHCTHK